MFKTISNCLTLGYLFSVCCACDHVICYVCSDIQDGNVRNCSHPLNTRNPYLNKVCCSDTDMCSTDIIEYYGTQFYIRNCSGRDHVVGCSEQPIPTTFERRHYKHVKCVCTGNFCNANGRGRKLYGSMLLIVFAAAVTYELRITILGEQL